MHFLLTNDDGIDAPGLRAMAAAAESLGGRWTIVAPAREHSQCGHRVTTHEPLRVEPRGEHQYAVHGTPADCVRIALFGLNVQPGMVLSGVNQGGNMGQDLAISGTVAAAREAAYHGLPAAAVSHYIISGIPFDWPRAGAWTAQILAALQKETLADGEFWNVNLPHLPPGALPLPKMLAATPARRPLNVSFSSAAEGVDTVYHYTARYAARPQDEGSDVAACFSGRVAVSRLGIGGTATAPVLAAHAAGE